MYVEEVNDMHIIYLDLVTINLDKEDNLDDEDEIIDIDVDLPNILSRRLTLTSTPDHSDSPKNPSLDLAMVPTLLEIDPLESYTPSLITIDQYRGDTKYS